MAYNYTTCNRDQPYLFPQNMKEWLPEDHLVWLLIDAVDQLDLSSFHASYRKDGRGQKAHHPGIMLSVLLYAYCHGERSSRKIERNCKESIPYRILASGTAPDHCAFARFRNRHAKAMEVLFVEVLRLCAESGLVSAGKVNLDGTKMKANASLAANRTEKALRDEIERMLLEAQTKDAAEDAVFGKDKSGNELPKGLRTREERLERLKEAKERLKRERLKAEKAQHSKHEERKRKEEETGRRPRGKSPKSVEDVRKEQEKRKANITAPESRILKTRSGYVQGFNAQAVCTDDQIILAAEVTDQENDQGLYHDMMTSAQEKATAVLGEKNGKIKIGRADAGFCSKATLEKTCDHEIIMATKKDWKRRKQMRESSPPRGRIPKSLSATERMERKLMTKRGRLEYKKRSQTIEPLFGQIKSALGMDSFYGRVLASAKAEWNLICAASNLIKLFRSAQRVQN